MILINATGGRTGNQLVVQAHLMASSLEYNIPFFNFGPTPSKDFIIRETPRQHSRHIPFLARLSGWLASHSFTRNCLEFIGIHVVIGHDAQPDEYVPLIRRTAQERSNLMPFLWPYSDYNALYKHQEECRNFITPKPEYRQQAAAIVAELRRKGLTLVGVHVRRTDYKTWLRGKYYYDTAVYEKAMKDVASLFPKGVCFIICSDDKLTKDDFPAFDTEQLYFSKNAFVTDFVLLASCDYIIGPPSTFSGYASFYGKAKKITLFSDHQPITSLEQFGVLMIDYDDIFEQITPDGDAHKKYLKLSEGRVVSCTVPTLPLATQTS